jgi:hypothetical protein
MRTGAVNAPDHGPPDGRLTELAQGYRKIQKLIFGEPPDFERLLEVLRLAGNRARDQWLSSPYL